MAESFFLAGLAAPSGFCSGVSMSAEGMAESWKIGGADGHGDRGPYFESQALNAFSEARLERRRAGERGDGQVLNAAGGIS